MDIQLDMAQKMISVCRECGVKLGIVMQHRFDEPMRLLKKAIKEGWMGRLLWGESRTLWYRDDSYYAPEWRGTWAVDGGGALMIQAIHYIDLLLSVMGNAKSVSAKCRTLAHPQIEVEDIGLANIEFEDGRKPEYDAALKPEMANQLYTAMVEDDSHRLQFEDFVAEVIEDRDPEVTGEEALKSLKLIHGIYRASREKGEIYL